MEQQSIQPVVLAILDGWGVAMPHRGNAISMAATPTFDEMVSRYFCVTLQASGENVGLPWGEVGNSEVGHLTIGSGTVLYQSLPRITRSVADGSFFANPAFLQAVQHVKKNNSSLHLMGLLSNGGVHSSDDHLYALLELCKTQGLKNVFVHVFLDGRDTPYNSGEKYVEELQMRMRELSVGTLATISGRFYAMDRDNHWDRVEKTYQALTEGSSSHRASDPLQAIRDSYKAGVYDEEFVPTVMEKEGKPVVQIASGDAVIFFNFRQDRCRELTKAFVLPGFSKFGKPQQQIKDLFFVTMTEYEKNLPVSAIAFPPEGVQNPLTKIISDASYKQLHVAETEKYPHVTFFFNGGQEAAFPGEERILIPSPRVNSYAEVPTMASKEITDAVCEAIVKNTYRFIVLNFASVDMVGHTGNLKATIEAVEFVDACLRRILQTTLDFGGTFLITADHGNAEEMMKSRSGLIDKEHSTNPVPCIIAGKSFENEAWQKFTSVGREDLSVRTPAGVLADVAPTILKILGLPPSPAMTGRPLI